MGLDVIKSQSLTSWRLDYFPLLLDTACFGGSYIFPISDSNTYRTRKMEAARFLKTLVPTYKN